MVATSPHPRGARYRGRCKKEVVPLLKKVAKSNALRRDKSKFPVDPFEMGFDELVSAVNDFKNEPKSLL